MSWTDGDFKIFAAGLAIGGKWNLGEVSANGEVECWNDANEFDHFYIKFKRSINTFSFSQFKKTILIYGRQGIITPTNAYKLDATTIYVEAPIQGEIERVYVIGLNTGYITHTTGAAIKNFLSAFVVDGESILTDLAYIYEEIAVRGAVDVTDTRSLVTYVGTSTTTISETVNTGHAVDISEDIMLLYL